MNLVENFKPCFILVLDFLARRGRLPGSEVCAPGEAPAGLKVQDKAETPRIDTILGLREKSLALLDQAEQNALAALDPERALTAKKMVAAWIDETILSRPWPDRPLWLRHPLQEELNLNRRAGEWFFQALDELDSETPEDRALAALALRCLSLNFKGCRHDNPLGLMALRKEKAALFKLSAPNPGFPAPLPEIKSAFFSSQSLKLVALALLLLILFWVGQHRYLDYLETKLGAKLHNIMPAPVRQAEEPRP